MTGRRWCAPGDVAALLAIALALVCVGLVLSIAVMQGEMAQLRRAATMDNLEYRHAILRLARCEASVTVMKAAKR